MYFAGFSTDVKELEIRFLLKGVNNVMLRLKVLTMLCYLSSSLYFLTSNLFFLIFFSTNVFSPKWVKTLGENPVCLKN
jgi:type IV secretory pathway TrbL component